MLAQAFTSIVALAFRYNPPAMHVASARFSNSPLTVPPPFAGSIRKVRQGRHGTSGSSRGTARRPPRAPVRAHQARRAPRLRPAARRRRGRCPRGRYTRWCAGLDTFVGRAGGPRRRRHCAGKLRCSGGGIVWEADRRHAGNGRRNRGGAGGGKGGGTGDGAADKSPPGHVHQQFAGAAGPCAPNSKA